VNDVVLDASVVLRWAFEDEADRDGAARMADALASGHLRAAGPPNFLLEVAAALVVGVRSGRIDRPTADTVLAALSRVSIDEGDPHGFAAAAYALGLDRGLRVPDAAYVETARRSGATLVSADRDQLRAAASAGITAVAISEVPAGTW
jgi:predicted nucleic acid-binding protein